ncbi:hypothetical protein BVI434_540014 [Burkholderia vietnamiensis]|nr:hypothetical protein BVI434_540014 [Burkholderia vietnamiensis]
MGGRQTPVARGSHASAPKELY